jgi:acyl-CoA thioester hydrolase
MPTPWQTLYQFFRIVYSGCLVTFGPRPQATASPLRWKAKAERPGRRKQAMNNTLHTEAGATAAHEHSRTAVAPIQTGSPDYTDKSLFSYRGVVYPWHLDSMDHMNVQHYTAAFDQSSWILLACVGLDAGYFRDTSSGMAALEQTIQYKAELRAGDVFEIHSSILEVREKTMRLRHEMYKSGTCTLAASTTIVGVHLDMDTRKGSPIPEPVRQRALRFVADDD